MSLKEQIESDIKKAMLNKNKGELLALRAIKSSILLAETEKGAHGDLTSETEMKLLMKAVKQRKDSANVYHEQNRQDLYEKETAEIEIINRYLPQSLSTEELKEEIEKIVKDLNAAGMKDMGKVMGVATKTLMGKSDGKTISDIVKSTLSGQ